MLFFFLFFFLFPGRETIRNSAIICVTCGRGEFSTAVMSPPAEIWGHGCWTELVEPEQCMETLRQRTGLVFGSSKCSLSLGLQWHFFPGAIFAILSVTDFTCTFTCIHHIYF